MYTNKNNLHTYNREYITPPKGKNGGHSEKILNQKRLNLIEQMTNHVLYLYIWCQKP